MHYQVLTRNLKMRTRKQVLPVKVNTEKMKVVSMEEVVHNQEPAELDNTNSDYENTEVGNKKKRGCSRGPPTANKNQQREHPDENIDKWNEVVGDNDLCLHEFRFIPAKEPGVQAKLDKFSTAKK